MDEEEVDQTFYEMVEDAFIGSNVVSFRQEMMELIKSK
jgi:hypothetical protein